MYILIHHKNNIHKKRKLGYMKKIILTIFFVIFLSSRCLAIDIDAIFDGTTKVACIHPEHNVCTNGTGFCIKINDELVILTAGHVIASEEFHEVLAWQFYPLKLIPAEVKKRELDIFSETQDYAVLKIPHDTQLRPIEISTEFPVQGEYLYIASCQEGNWIAMKKVMCEEITDNIIKFSPAPRPGASGAALLNKEGKVVGLVVKSDENKYGIAIRINKIPLN